MMWYVPQVTDDMTLLLLLTQVAVSQLGACERRADEDDVGDERPGMLVAVGAAGKAQRQGLRLCQAAQRPRMMAG